MNPHNNPQQQSNLSRAIVIQGPRRPGMTAECHYYPRPRLGCCCFCHVAFGPVAAAAQPPSFSSSVSVSPYLKFLCVAIFQRLVFLLQRLDVGHKGLQALLYRHNPVLVHGQNRRHVQQSWGKVGSRHLVASSLSGFTRPFFISEVRSCDQIWEIWQRPVCPRLSPIAVTRKGGVAG